MADNIVVCKWALFLRQLEIWAPSATVTSASSYLHTWLVCIKLSPSYVTAVVTVFLWSFVWFGITHRHTPEKAKQTVWQNKKQSYHSKLNKLKQIILIFIITLFSPLLWHFFIIILYYFKVCPFKSTVCLPCIAVVWKHNHSCSYYTLYWSFRIVWKVGKRAYQLWSNWNAEVLRADLFYS